MRSTNQIWWNSPPHFGLQTWANLEKLGLQTTVSGAVLLTAAESLAELKPSDSQARKKSATLVAELNKAAGGHNSF
jgi:hypothetical protein